jgi:hypothetical protein
MTQKVVRPTRSLWVQPLQGDKRVGDRHQRHVMVPARDGAPLEVVQPQRVLQLALIVLHPSAQRGQAHQPLKGAVGGQAGQPVGDWLGLTVWPLGRPPAHRQLLAAGRAAQPNPGRAHRQRREPGGSRSRVGVFGGVTAGPAVLSYKV